MNGTGTKTFQLIVLNGIMNLTYIDLDTGEYKYCESSCPLYDASQLSSYASNLNSRPDIKSTYRNGALHWSEVYQLLFQRSQLKFM